MATTIQIIQYAAQASDPSSPESKDNSALSNAISALSKLSPTSDLKHFVLGTQISDQAFQITLETTKESKESSSSLITQALQPFLGSPKSSFHVTLSSTSITSPPFSSSSSFPLPSAAAPVVEYAISYFPVSLVTPSFRQQIEADFARFDALVLPIATGNHGLSTGWVEEGIEHEGIKGEKATAFVIIRGWESLGHFQKSIDTDEFRGALPILLGWKAPFVMTHVERKLLDGVVSA